MSSRDVKDFANAILNRVGKRMFGVDEVTRLTLVALYTGGHVLLEGNPGLGKTELVKTLGDVLALPRGRIQFTPDLMPADITGTYTPDFDNGNPQKMVFQQGPVFTSLLLADEINRATPKTQSAMLEAMAEKQVTVLGKKWNLEIPFMVLATQNPIDHEGTFNLPEAQADRFMFKLSVPVPNRGTLRLIMDKTAGDTDNEEPEKKSYSLFKDVRSSRETYLRLEKRIKKLPVSPPVEVHILNMFLASNRQFDELKELNKGQIEKLKRLVNDVLEYGLGPRAATAMTLGAKAFSLMFLPGAESAEGPALARVVIPSLRHRFKLKFDWQQAFCKIEGLKEIDDRYSRTDDEEMVIKMIRSFCLAAAPSSSAYSEYSRNFEGSFLRGGKI